MSAAVTTITSRDNPLVVRARKIATDAAFSRAQGLCWIEGDHLCGAALLRHHVPTHAFVTADAWAQPTGRRLALAAQNVVVVSPALMAGIGMLESPASIAYLLRTPVAPPIRGDLPTLVLDRVQDPGNVGSILRSASAFGFVQVVALKGTAALWSSKVVRAGMGAHFALSLIEQADQGALSVLTMPWVGTSSHASDVLGRVGLPYPCAWVVGHEGQGVAPALLSACARVVRIAQPGGEESLNVAVAAAICMHESVRALGG